MASLVTGKTRAQYKKDKEAAKKKKAQKKKARKDSPFNLGNTATKVKNRKAAYEEAMKGM